MENFKTYGLAQFAIGNAAKYTALVSLALDTVATVQNWTLANKPKSKAECEAALKIAMIVSKVPETSARRVLSTVSGIVSYLGRDYKDTLATIKSAMMDVEPITAESAVSMMVSVLQADGIENLGFLEAYARKGKPGLAAIKAETEAKIADVERKAAMSEDEAKAAAETERQEATQAAADLTPRAKAAKGAAAILAAMAKHGELMTGEELTAIASAIAAIQLGRLSVADDKRAADIAADLSAKAEEKAEKRKAA